MIVYDTFLSWNSYIHHVTQIQNPLPRGEKWYSIFRSIKLGNGSKYDRHKPEKGQVHLCKHLKRATNLWMLKQKNRCLVVQQDIQCQARVKNTPCFTLLRPKSMPFETSAAQKPYPLRHISDRLSRGVISLFPPSSPLPFRSQKHLKTRNILRIKFGTY